MSPAVLGAVIGAAFGVGSVLVLLHNPWTRPRAVHRRIDPYVRRSQRRGGFAAYEHALSSHPFLRRNILPPVRSAARLTARWFGSEEEITRRLRLAGREDSADAFRAEQALWAVAAFTVALISAILLITLRDAGAVPMLILVLVMTVLGALARDKWLSMQIQRRSEQLAREFPTVADLLALAVAAGEGTVAAMERVSRTTTGPLAHELGRTVADIRAGATVEDAFRQLGRRTSLETITRFTDGVTVAIERGTPLADVLRAQAQDARDAGRRDLMETAGKREIWMLIPVVFLLMPMVIVFAIFPGLSVLSISL
ncbi:type II secretion system F family protein [Helcobacillus massiliensis]|uniref:Tight adherence protein C n=1 Tax=Helcobacillus massiliensis TaxID=521392 RepID=A0A839QNX3_9MICO|nr:MULTISPECIES: type II secretion system F family protein [Helcobacillus]MBB3022004.1 tight adherence protein C [Helcobacillus massiliensis]MCG7426898.1 type II secretion system F family protein [Helcobacillus sp. ACRRO]MCT1557440.1 type II secretion system F family protein [Helcobacillus massiliensis]MCT2036379.1 type II secretion system F family protein [Helcobacillus massiliensis]MCT2331879.1 type II secretion system F family protein [Helcobacillus massiliensis]